jgi:hypothetical protein
MPRLFDSGQDRETLAILMALVKLPFMGEQIWQTMGQPYWHGVNVDFVALLGSDELTGDADIIGIPGINGLPDFDSMFAIEVKVYKFDLKGNLKGMGSKLDKADAQANKLQQLGFAKTGILHVLTTENKPERDRGGSSGWSDATDRAGDAYFQFMPFLKDRKRLHNVFVWPFGAHPSLDEDRAGVGCPLFIGGPEAPSEVRSSKSMRTVMINNLKTMIADLPRPPVWGQPSLPTVFGRCAGCAGIIQHYWDGTECKKCGWRKATGSAA